MKGDGKQYTLNTMFWKKGSGVEKRLYADAAAATPLSKNAQKELMRLLPLYGNPGALHREGVEAKKELEHARNVIAASIGAHADEIVFSASGTEANNLALQGLLRPLLRERGEVHAVSTVIEHHSVLVPLRALLRDGLYTTQLPVDVEGLVEPATLLEAIHEETALVSVQLVNSEIGTIQPVREIAKTLRKCRQKDLPAGRQVYFHTDASQAPLWLPIKVDALGVDLMTLDAQKILGPKGIGCLYIKRGTPLEPFVWGGGQEGGMRAGTENVPLAGAFALALAEAQKNAVNNSASVGEIRNYLASELKRCLPDVVIHGPSFKHRVANNLNISVPGLSAEMAVIALDAEGIAVSTRSACGVGESEPSHVLRAIGAPETLAGSAIRITLMPDATKKDADRIVRTLMNITDRYRVGSFTL